MRQRVRGLVRLLRALPVACLMISIVPTSAELATFGNLASVDGVTVSVLAEGQVIVNFYQGDPEFGWSEISLHRYQMTPGMAAENGPTYATSGDEDSTTASIAFVEYGTVNTEDSDGNRHTFTSPAAIHDATKMSNSSLDCTWVLSASHVVSKSMGGGAFTDAPNMLLPSSTPCDKSVETLVRMNLDADILPGKMTAFIGEIEIEPGFEVSNFTENGFLGIALESGDLQVSSHDSAEQETGERQLVIHEGTTYSIAADESAGASGLIFGFIRESTTAMQPVAVASGSSGTRWQLVRRLH